MKKVLLICLIVVIASCTKDNDDNEILQQVITPQLTFNHQWDGEDIDIFNSSEIQYTNANGEMMSIERLRYLITDVTFERANGEDITIAGFHLLDIDNAGTLTFNTEVEIPADAYSNVYFRFGFDDTDNIDGAYPDLNAANWNVPMMLGGGYHYMQLEGRFINDLDEQLNYQFHTIRAAQNPGPDVENTDTSFAINLGAFDGTSTNQLTINVDLAEWFKNPIIWNLSDLYTMLMPNYDAQLMMSQNGPSVFSRGITLEL